MLYGLPSREITKRHYEQDDDSVLQRNIANAKAFHNAMTVDIAMGGSTNTHQRSKRS